MGQAFINNKTELLNILTDSNRLKKLSNELSVIELDRVCSSLSAILLERRTLQNLEIEREMRLSEYKATLIRKMSKDGLSIEDLLPVNHN